MKGRIVVGIMLTLLLTSILMFAASIQPVKASGTIYIRANGSIDPSTAPISTVDNVTYTLKANIYDYFIVVERNNIIIDGKGYTVQGTEEGNGFSLASMTNVTIKNTSIKGFTFGINLYSSSYNNMIGNNIEENADGVWLGYSSNYNNISGNNIANNSIGIYFYSSNYNSISGNNIEENSLQGISLYSSNYNNISGNDIARSSWEGIYVVSSSNNSIDGDDITSNNYGIWLHFSNYNNISGSNIRDNNHGIRLDSSSNNRMSENNVTENNHNGIYIYSSSNYNSISGNNIAVNNDIGIYVSSSNYTSISESNIEDNYYGIWLHSSSNYNNISGSNIKHNYYGIWLGSSSNNTVSESNIIDNWYGVYCYESITNKFYHNYFFVNRLYQVYTFNWVNIWDDGYPSGGNYWNDYPGVDVKNGPGQDLPGSDGIGDTAYPISANNRDNYPLMKPYAGLHDIGITDITTSKTVIGQNLTGPDEYNLTITVKVVNYGVTEETFNLTIYAGTIPINITTDINLPSKNFTIVAFNWNPNPGFAKGTYRIWAYATPVKDEKATGDNTSPNVFVKVSTPGDVDGDGVVGGLDAGLLGYYWPPQPYDANCDINGDGVIGGLDQATIGYYWGKTDP